MKYRNLRNFTYALLGRGELIFSKDEALCFLGISDAALRNSIKRQVKSKSLIRLMRGYYLIIPPEYQNLGVVPPELFINDLMKSLQLPYYVGLLSAASFYGATHQATRNLQVMTRPPLKDISLGTTSIKFYVNKKLSKVTACQVKTDRGPLTISTPETTCFDLMDYRLASGGINNASTALEAIAEHIQKPLLREICPLFPLSSCQRLGYLFEHLGFQDLSNALQEHLLLNKPYQYIPLIPGLGGGEKNAKWHLIINDRIEPDL